MNKQIEQRVCLKIGVSSRSRTLRFFCIFLIMPIQLPGVDGVVPNAVKTTGYGANGVHKGVGQPNYKDRIFLP